MNTMQDEEFADVMRALGHPVRLSILRILAEKQSDFEINSALKMLLHALKTGNQKVETADDPSQKPRRVLLCLGSRKDEVAKILTDSGYRVYIAQTPAQANERLREG